MFSDLGGPVSSPDTIQRLLDKGSRDIVKSYDVCRDGCYLFSDSEEDLHCHNADCQKSRYKNQTPAEESILEDYTFSPTAFQTMSISSVGSSLAELLIDDDIRSDFEYSSQFGDYDEEDTYIDMFSGSVYKSFREQGLIQPKDICLVLYVDGFPNKYKPKSSQTLIHCMVMNIPASKR